MTQKTCNIRSKGKTFCAEKKRKREKEKKALGVGLRWTQNDDIFDK